MLDYIRHDNIATRTRKRYDRNLNNIKQYWTMLDSTGQYEIILENKLVLVGEKKFMVADHPDDL